MYGLSGRRQSTMRLKLMNEQRKPLWELLGEACAENPDYPGVPNMAQSDAPPPRGSVMRSNPTVICEACGKSRNCMLHTRAEFPPDAAKAWLRRHCDNPRGSCQFRYQAGVVIGLGSVSGMANEIP